MSWEVARGVKADSVRLVSRVLARNLQGENSHF